MENRTGMKSRNGNFSEQADHLRDQAQHLRDEAMEQIDHLREQASEIGERVVEFIKERPGTSILIAAAAGYVIGRILRS